MKPRKPIDTVGQTWLGLLITTPYGIARHLPYTKFWTNYMHELRWTVATAFAER